MEIILALIAIGLAGYWFWYRNKSENMAKDSTTEPTVVVEEAPYKIETPPAPAPVPEPKRCGCGRSASGFCVGLHALTPEQWAEHPDNPRKPTPAKPAPAKRAAKKSQPAAASAKKPAAKKAAAKKPKE